MTEVREITLTGDAAKDINTPKKRKTRKSGGGSTSAGTIVQLQTMTPQSSPQDTPDTVGVLPKMVSHAAEVGKPLEPISGGATSRRKVVLKAAPKKHQKVTLSISKNPQIVNHVNLNMPLKNKTHKVSKSTKIKFSLKNLSKKLNKAKTIKKHAQEKSLDDIKKILEQAKLIKVGSKAPEAMIRQIYADFMVLKHKAL
jgi:hypothetical protein